MKASFIRIGLQLGSNCIVHLVLRAKDCVSRCELFMFALEA